jgi:hypothetical protein
LSLLEVTGEAEKEVFNLNMVMHRWHDGRTLPVILRLGVRILPLEGENGKKYILI